MSKKGHRYNQKFKEDIIKLINDEKRSVSSVVKDFGVNEQTIRNWLKGSIQIKEVRCDKKSLNILPKG